MVDATFQLIAVKSRSYWRELARPPLVEEVQDEEEEVEEESQDREAHDVVPLLPYTMPSSSSSGESNLLA